MVFQGNFNVIFPSREAWIIEDNIYLSGIMSHARGSLFDGKSGSGIFNLSNNDSKSKPMESFVSVFHAEIYAIIACKT